MRYVRYLKEESYSGATSQLLCNLIGALGTLKFEDSMLSLAQNALRCTHLSAFSMSRTRPPRFLIAADPRIGQGATIRMLPQEVGDALYQRDCYLSASLVDRVSIVKRQAGEVVRLNFYRNKAQGRFSDGDLNVISQHANVLVQIISKHDTIRPPPDGEDRYRQYCGRLALAAPQLTEREIQVCAGIVRGLSSEAIAGLLGLSINTVLTHRRRAYAKLHISSQNELSHMLLQ